MTTERKLYEVSVFNPTTRQREVKYGHKLAVDSSGQWVMELIGEAHPIISVPKTDVEEVRPHTIDITFENRKGVYQYLAEKGKYNVGDFFIFDGLYGRAIVEVVAVDTKSDKATVEFTPRAKLVTEPVEQKTEET